MAAATPGAIGLAHHRHQGVTALHEARKRRDRKLGGAEEGEAKRPARQSAPSAGVPASSPSSLSRRRAFLRFCT